jgi:hypothetical protein
MANAFRSFNGSIPQEPHIRQPQPQQAYGLQYMDHNPNLLVVSRPATISPPSMGLVPSTTLPPAPPNMPAPDIPVIPVVPVVPPAPIPAAITTTAATKKKGRGRKRKLREVSAEVEEEGTGSMADLKQKDRPVTIYCD